MEIRVLRYFLGVAREGSVTHAAERLDRGLLDFSVIAQAVDLSKYNYLELPGAEVLLNEMKEC